VKETVLQLFRDHPQAALLLSLACSVAVAILGLVPSVFITAANILFFGFWKGILVSFAGEAIGALVAFLLYRRGFQKGTAARLSAFPRLQPLLLAKNREAATLIFSMRLLPFVPSGLVTFAAAVGRVSTLHFALASSLGKIPALLLEGYSVYAVTQFGWPGKILLAAIAVFLVYWTVKRLYAGRRH
jgi:uncharacterized membrane protein YdjX (TVP38/TMEM64 family)